MTHREFVAVTHTFSHLSHALLHPYTCQHPLPPPLCTFIPSHLLFDYFSTSRSNPQDLADDEDLVELQLNCVAVFVGNRPPEDSLNTAMLQAAQEVDINHYYKELPHFVSVTRQHPGFA